MTEAKRENGSASLQGWLRVALAVAVLLVSGYGGYVTLGGLVKANSERSEKNEVKGHANEIGIIRMQADIDYIKIAVDKNAAGQQEILKELRQK